LLACGIIATIKFGSSLLSVFTLRA